MRVAPSCAIYRKAWQISRVALRVVTHADGRQTHALTDADRRGIGAGDGRKHAQPVNLDDREDARAVEPRRQPRVLHGERVNRALAREIHPLEGVRRTLAAEAARRP